MNQTHDIRLVIASRIAAIAAAFCITVCALLAYDFWLRGAKDPAEETSYKALNVALDAQPKNEPLKESVRQLNLELSRQYFRHKAFRGLGAGLLAGGLIVFVIALKTATTLRRRLPDPSALPTAAEAEANAVRAARWGWVALTLVLALGMTGLAVGVRLPWPTHGPLAALSDSANTAKSSGASPDAAIENADLSASTPEASSSDAPDDAVASSSSAASGGTPAATTGGAPAASSAPPPLSDEALADAWPRFRGPGGLGISKFTDVPEHWDAATGENILWKTKVPLPGNSSPIVFGKQVYLSGANETTRQVYCFNADTGALTWQQDVPNTPQSATPVRVNEDTGYAAPTMATDGVRVFAIFANGDIAAYTLDGQPVWSKSFGIPENSYGHASSLLVAGGMLLAQIDQATADENLSKLYAMNCGTGEPIWIAPRAISNSWTTPIVIRQGDRRAVITAANPAVIAYDLANGRELWRAECLEQDVGPSPVFADGVVYAANEYPGLSAIRADGSGDVTETNILWKAEDDIPDISSPLAAKDFVIVGSSLGYLTCFNAADGEQRWQMEFEPEFSASPSLVGDHVYVVGKDGHCWVIAPGESEGTIVAESNLGEACVTSPAFQPGRIYLRGADHLFCLGKKP